MIAPASFGALSPDAKQTRFYAEIVQEQVYPIRGRPAPEKGPAMPQAPHSSHSFGREDVMEFQAEMKYVLDTIWLLISGALVMWMAAGFAMLEAGMVRTKNVTAILTKNIALYSVACIAFYLIGYNLMYGEGNAVLGSGFALSGTSADGHSLLSDFFFQVVFVATAASIVSGTVAERVRFWPFMIFTLVLTAIIYPIQGHWTWGGTSLGGLIDGFSDFAGSTIVHSVGGWAGLAGALLLGARKGKYDSQGNIHPMPASSLPLSTLGTFVLWLGWFGFNAGSALAANEGAGMAMLVTHVSAATASLTWMTIEWIKFGKPSLVGIVTGMVAGLATITPASGFVGPLGALVYGISAGIVCYYGVTLVKRSLKIDDSLDVFAVHGVGGILGILLVAVFASPDLGGMGYAKGMTMGTQFVVQMTGTAATVIWSIIGTIVIIKIVSALVGLRVDDEAETDGLDLSEHGERGYN